MKKYPMRIIQGAFHLPDGESLLLADSKVVCNGWGEVGTLRIDGDEPRSLPTALSIDWYSYTEDAFFSAEVELPADRFSETFVQGHTDPVTGDRHDFRFISVGIALEGHLTLWAIGGGTTIEVSSFVGDRIEIPFESVFGSDVEIEVYREAALECMRETAGVSGESLMQPIPVGLWAVLHRRFPTRVVLSGGDNAQIWLKTTDGQCKYYEMEDDAEIPVTPLAMLSGGSLYWQTIDEKSWRADFSMKEDELLWAYDKIQQLANQSAITLLIELGNKFPAVYIGIRVNNWLIPLTPVVDSIVPG